jgi:hypothetical protein
VETPHKTIGQQVKVNLELLAENCRSAKNDLEKKAIINKAEKYILDTALSVYNHYITYFKDVLENPDYKDHKGPLE